MSFVTDLIKYMPSALKPAGISAAGGALRTDLLIPTTWATATAYAANAAVTQGGVAYLAVVAHTSGTFATDLAAGKWAVYQGVTATDLSNTTDMTKGTALVGHHAETAATALDRRQPELGLHRLKNALSNIVTSGAGAASLAFFGDSITRSLIPDDVIKQLYRAYGFRGAWCGAAGFGSTQYSTLNLTGGGASGASAVAGRFTTSPSGNVFSLSASGHRVSFGVSLTQFHPDAYVNRATLIYTKKASGGVFKVQTVRANGAEYPVDVVGSTAVDTSAATTSLGTIVVNLPAREIGGQISVLWQSGGDVEIIGALLEDTTGKGVVVSYLDQGGIDLSQTNTLIPAGLATLLGVLAPDMIYWAMKDSGVAAKLVTHQALWDGAYATDWLYSAPYPDSVAATAAEARAYADPVIAHAVAYGHDFWDPLIDCPSYAYGTAQGWFADTVHFNTKATYTLGPHLWRATGLLPSFRAGSQTADVRTAASTVDTLTVAGVDYAATQGELRETAISAAKRGIKFTASTDSYVASEAATTAPGTGSYTLVTFVRVPTGGAVNQPIASLRLSAAAGGNQNGSAILDITTTALRLVQRSVAGVQGIFSVNAAATAVWARPGEIVMLACRRDASASNEAPITLWVDGVKYVSSNQTTNDPLTDLPSATFFKVGNANGNIGTTDLEMFGGAYYTSALTDAQMATMARTGRFISGGDTAWTFDEQGGSVVGKPPAKTGKLAGSWTWLQRFLPKPSSSPGGSLTLTINETFIQNRTDATRVSALLPAAPALGDYAEVLGGGSGGWKITQPAGHQIVEGAGGTVATNATTAGVTGFLQSGARYDNARLRCVISDSVTPSYIWAIERKNGTLTFS